ncbi:ATP-binding protein [Sphingopyxis flava]|uniref:histidine kinase n=1 Tax=Sphingopyxis flava TaxID=1507287 RepID=A0A1T5EUX8_9SPHN|nr:ATP-binding protein [Sphingopyxis flava]SKB87764.1 PAS domain S-box-containing protein [Sphingopyxis flava]
MISTLRDSLRQDAGIAEFASESIVIIDLEGSIRYWNPAAERLFGWPGLAVGGAPVADISAAPEDEVRAWSQLLQEGVWEGQIRRLTRDGEVRVVEARRRLRHDEAGIPCDVVEYAHLAQGANGEEIPDRSAPDVAMAASWEIDLTSAAEILDRIRSQSRTSGGDDRGDLCRRLLEAARIVDVNERTARLVGGNRGRELMKGQSVASFWPVASRAILAELIVQAFLDSEGKRFHRWLASDGILREPLVTIWRAGADRPGHLFITVNGTADDDRSYLFLRASEARYRKLVHYMPVALWQVDASHMGKIYADLRSRGVTDFGKYLDDHPELVGLAASSVPVTDVNRSAIELMGGKDAQDLIGPAGYLFTESPECLRRVMIGRFSGDRNYSELMKLRTLDGRVLDVRFSVTYPEPLVELDTTIFSLEDMTERLQMETQLRQIQADFSHAARIATLGELTSSIAHEVNQPLAAIMTNAETSLRWLARAEPDIGKVRQLTARIAASARRADNIVQRIRSMAIKQSPDPVTLELNEVVRESLLFVQNEIEQRGIRVTTTYSRDLPTVVGDRIQLQQVIVNLIINAVHAVEGLDETEREILVVTGVEGGSATFTLKDNGPGIAPEHLGRIFDGFFTTKPQGMGIGLAICQSIVTAHGGAVSASNRTGGGAQFRVTLPRARSLT